MDRSPSLLGLHTSTKRLPPSEGMQNKVTVAFETVIDDIHEDPVTGIQTLIESSPVDSLFSSINFSIASTNPSHICDLLIGCLMNSLPIEIFVRHIGVTAWIWESLACHIASAASNLGFGTNGFEINLLLTSTQRRVSVGSSSSLLQKLVFEGTIDREELKKLKMGKEPCSICLENLSCGGGIPMRMPCSHVFHDRCLLEWLSRKGTCPMCRRVVLRHMKQQHREGQWGFF